MTTTTKELRAALAAVRKDLEAILAALNDAQMIEVDNDGWSVKDTLAHIVAWEVELLTNLGKVGRGQKPSNTDWNPASIQDQNEKWHAQYHHRPLERVLIDFSGVRQQTLRILGRLSDAELSAPAGWLGGKPLASAFVDYVLAHEQEHVEALRSRLKQRATDGRDAESPNGSYRTD